MLIEYLFMCVITTDFHGHLGTLNKDSKNENVAMLQYSQQKEIKLCPQWECVAPSVNLQNGSFQNARWPNAIPLKSSHVLVSNQCPILFTFHISAKQVCNRSEGLQQRKQHHF